MSFTAEVKDELSRVPAECPSCDRATLAALIRIEGTLSISGPGRYRLELATETSSVARTAIRLLHSIYDLKTELTVRRSVLHKTHNYLITIPAQPKLPKMLDEMGILGSQGLDMGVAPHLVERPCCLAAYLRGVFMACGFISDPKGDFHFEMNVESRTLADDLVRLMQEHGVDAKVTQRRNSYTVYLKGSDRIVSFLALTSAHHAALQIENERVRKSIRNDVNRAVNAELANQMKASDAAASQIRDIELIERHLGLESLSPALQDFCELRRRNDSVSLRELGELATPPLSKSAVYHRVRRLEEIATELREKGLV